VRVSLTCDLWTSRSKQGFLSNLSFYYCTIEMKEITLAIRYIPYPHTANAIQKFLFQVWMEAS